MPPSLRQSVVFCPESGFFAFGIEPRAGAFTPGAVPFIRRMRFHVSERTACFVEQGDSAPAAGCALAIAASLRLIETCGLHQPGGAGWNPEGSIPERTVR
jgi:hypothetical protein